jgi:hypothetical protein
MSDSSTTGLRGRGTNIYYYFPYTGGAEYDAPKQPPRHAQYPTIVDVRKDPKGTKHDVRATYHPSHVLRYPEPSCVEPLPVEPLPTPPTLNDLFLTASVPSMDSELLKLQQEERRKYMISLRGNLWQQRGRQSSKSPRETQYDNEKQSKPSSSSLRIWNLVMNSTILLLICLLFIYFASRAIVSHVPPPPRTWNAHLSNLKTFLLGDPFPLDQPPSDDPWTLTGSYAVTNFHILFSLFFLLFFLLSSLLLLLHPVSHFVLPAVIFLVGNPYTDLKSLLVDGPITSHHSLRHDPFEPTDSIALTNLDILFYAFPLLPSLLYCVLPAVFFLSVVYFFLRRGFWHVLERLCGGFVALLWVLVDLVDLVLRIMPDVCSLGAFWVE